MDLSRELDLSVRAGDVDRVRSLLQENDVNLRAPENSHLLWRAIFRDDFPIIELLIRAGADLAAEYPLDDGEGHGYSILHELIDKAEDDEEYVRLALLAIEHGADVNARDDDDQSALVLAVHAPRSRELMEALRSRGAQVDNGNLRDLLENAAIVDGRAAEMLPLLIALNDPSVEARNQRIITAIVAQFLSPEYNLHAFEELLQMVVDVDQHGLDGFTMLAAAARSGRSDAVKVLLNRGADINKKTTVGLLPIYAGSMSDNSAVTELLISAGASIHDRIHDGGYPIHGACSSRTVDNLHFLLSRGASANVADYEGLYPLHYACANDVCPEILHLLLSLIGTSINVTDVQGNTPLSLMSRQNLHSTTIPIFIKQFAFVRITTGAVSEDDWAIIKANPEMFRFYQSCYNELQMIGQIEVYQKSTILLSLFSKNTTKLSLYLKNIELAVVTENCVEQQRAQFPTYFKQFSMALQIAKRKHDVIENIENILEESFPVAIPCLAIRKITLYALFEELNRLELDFYLALYKRIKAQGQHFATAITTLKYEN